MTTCALYASETCTPLAQHTWRHARQRRLTGNAHRAWPARVGDLRSASHEHRVRALSPGTTLPLLELLVLVEIIALAS